MKYMKLAVELAEKATPCPNPKVGCVIVKSGRVIGKGYHRQCGGPHAEISALNSAGTKAKGATMYVTLEPCCTVGRTPACTSAIIEAGVRKVVIGVRDKNPKNCSGIEVLRKNKVGVEIISDKKLQERITKMNESFNKFIVRKMPFVTLKLGMSIDGKTALDNGKSKWITNPESLKRVHEMRSKTQAIMTGIGTVLKDNPKLTSRVKGGKDPVRIIVDSRFRAPLNLNVFNDDNVIVIATKLASKKRLDKAKKKGIKIILADVKDGHVDLKDMMKKLAKVGISEVMVEAGPRLASALIKEKLVDKFCCFIAPKILGSDTPAIKGLGIASMKRVIQMKEVKFEQLGDNMLIQGYL